jgi:hypothetical protein
MVGGSEGLERYVSHGSRSVRGWLHPADAQLLVAADQVTSGPADLVEVGAFLGASAIELGFFCRPGERLVVIDPFEDLPDDRWAPDAGLSVDAFLANWRRFHPQDPAVMVGRSETELPKLAAGSARLVHIDGDHHFEAVRSDVAEALRIATPDAVLVFDDVGPWQWPTVAAAVWKSVTDGDLVPLAVTAAKLYATLPGSAVRSTQLVEAARARGMRIEGPHPLCGWDVWEAHEPAPAGPARVRRLAAGLVPPAAGSLARRARAIARSRRR